MTVSPQEIHESQDKALAWVRNMGWSEYYDDNSGLITIDIDALLLSHDVPVLPEQYAFKGGTARAVIALLLQRPASSSRDFDLLYVGHDQDYVQSQKMQAQLNPDDYDRYHTVEQLRDDYFETRDFSINELYVTTNQLICTARCVVANYFGLVVPTNHILRQHNSDDPLSLKPHLMCKALRFFSLYQTLDYGDATIVYPDNFIAPVLDSFHMALHLDRSCASGRPIAEQYIQNLIAYGAISRALSDVSALQEYLSWDSDYVFMYS